ncbi:M24 family metallopeptidase [Planctomicrobium piriforme]|uniref:Xaa-Pro aminopeptidase n=1 Tax=Planctomicrobium piriforme TaxID=1576369 RepID=A0A1I3IIE6_9PLAN|nr:Xaa-Pro peptidase family protein [Planctomicrobium piriforme]SFI47553.1 Xaa-Pro aminopeptidase [Planctomicrobium piriforme]
MSFSPESFQRRREQVRKVLRSRKLDALLVTGERNVAWLSGFTGDSTWLLVTQDKEVLLSDFRFVTQIEEECPGVTGVIRSSSQRLTDILAETCGQLHVERCGFEGHLVTVETAELFRNLPDPTTWVSTTQEIEQLRAIKDRDEIAEIREAVRFAERGFRCFQAALRPDKTERQLSAELEHAMRGFGAAGFCFPAIVAVGDRAALPHYRAGNNLLSASPILLLDWGARAFSGYCSDLTRTMVTAKPDKTFEKVYRTVLEAQLAAIQKIGPGVRCGDVDAVARQFIAAAGYGKYFDHGLGHGIGLDVHEVPRLSRNSDVILKPGMVVTVEPGIYLPGWGGVRIEDDVLVTRQGCEVLSSLPKDWDSVLTAC